VQIPETERVSWFFPLATFVIVVAILRFAENVLMPVAFAVLLAFLLSPLVIRLVRWGVPRAIAIILTVTVAFAAIGGIGWIVTAQVIGLVRELPNYEENIRRKIVAVKTPRTPAVMERMSGMVENLRREIKSVAPDKPVTPATPDEVKPVPVELKPAEPTPWEIAREIVGPILRPLGVSGIVLVFVVVMLFQREDLRDRFIKLVSAGKLNVATQAIDDAASRVSRYLGMQLIVNALYGVPIGIGLFLIGIPNALLWGLLATLLRFIPFVGPWIAAAFPIALSIAVDPGWTKLFYTLGLVIVMEVVSNNFIEVILYGASTGISSLALLVAAVFWTWLWGPAGLVLSTPLTVCLLVIGKYVPGLSYLSMLLGSEPVLEPPAHLYQRMLSMESEDMLDLAEKHIEEHSLAEFYEDIFVPALLLAEQDRHGGSLPESRQRFIFQSSRELIDELERQDDQARVEDPVAAAKALEEPAAQMPAVPLVIGVPARDEADEVVALMVAHLLRRRGITAAVTPLAVPIDEAFKAADRSEVRAAFISALPPSAVGAARQMGRRLRARSPGTPVLVGVWRHRASHEELEKRLHASQPDEIVTLLGEAVEQLEAMVTGKRSHPRTAESVPVVAHERPAQDTGSAPPFKA
jgi:predicted PurR-regulated permease PerM/methylmalonyl-CoA mutase cobalamin-binding subunit